MGDPVEADKVLSHLAEIEVVAEEILSTRREIIDMDRQRNKTREAIRYSWLKKYLDIFTFWSRI